MNTRDPIYDLAVLCRNMFRKSFKDLSYSIYEDLTRRAVLEVRGSVLIEFIVDFYVDHCVTAVPGWGSYDTSKIREVSYNDPNLMDILLSELKKQVRNR